MTRHLIAVSIGPVQDFIAAARRTRDLWFGSFLLSEISKAAASGIKAEGGNLIFPSNDQDLSDDINVANVILAELPEGLQPKEIVAKAKICAHERWKKYNSNVKRELHSLIRDDIWNSQAMAEDIIEFYSAWAPLINDEKYYECRRDVMRLLAGRKACRDFTPAKGFAGVPKSSLDGARESVLKKDRDAALTPAIASRLRLADGEQLDIVGLIKRYGGGRQGYPSLPRIAADSWLRGVYASQDEDFAVFKTESERLTNQGITRVNLSQFSAFPYEGDVVYKNRYKEFAEETGGNESDYDGLKNILERLTKRFGEPEPYLAILVADGDRMGKVISSINSIEQHRQLSSKLSLFAGEANKIVQENSGCLVYSGGDDVLAFLPVDKVLQAASELHKKFGDLLEQWKDNQDNSPTLSVGIAIGHCMEPMEDLLEYARSAEKKAKKPDRDGLAVHLHPRGGAPIGIRAQWSSEINKRLTDWAEQHMAMQIPDSAAYDLRELLRDYENWQDENTYAMRKDILQLLKRKKGNKGNEGLTKLEELINNIRNIEDAKRIAEEIIIARRIAAAMVQAEGKQRNCITA